MTALVQTLNTVVLWLCKTCGDQSIHSLRDAMEHVETHPDHLVHGEAVRRTAVYGDDCGEVGGAA